MSHGIVTSASRKMGFKPISTDEFVGRAIGWLAEKTTVVIELNDLDKRYKVTHGGRFNSGNTLPIALANAVVDHE